MTKRAARRDGAAVAALMKSGGLDEPSPLGVYRHPNGRAVELVLITDTQATYFVLPRVEGDSWTTCGVAAWLAWAGDATHD